MVAAISIISISEKEFHQYEEHTHTGLAVKHFQNTLASVYSVWEVFTSFHSILTKWFHILVSLFLLLNLVSSFSLPPKTMC